jgi:hypothetical protein
MGRSSTKLAAQTPSRELSGYLKARMHAEFPENCADVNLDRTLGQVKVVADEPVWLPLQEALQDVRLSRRQSKIFNQQCFHNCSSREKARMEHASSSIRSMTGDWLQSETAAGCCLCASAHNLPEPALHSPPWRCWRLAQACNNATRTARFGVTSVNEDSPAANRRREPGEDRDCAINAARANTFGQAVMLYVATRRRHPQRRFFCQAMYRWRAEVRRVADQAGRNRRAAHRWRRAARWSVDYDPLRPSDCAIVVGCPDESDAAFVAATSGSGRA